MISIAADKLLTATGWKNHQVITVDAQGYISSIEDNQQNATDFQSELIIPGFINLHSHAFQWSMAGLAEEFGKIGDSFWSWRQLMYQFVQTIQPEDLAVIAESLYIDMLKAGYTEVGEFHYLHNDIRGVKYSQPELLSVLVIEAAKKAGIAICHLPVLYQNAGFNQQSISPLQTRFQLTTEEIILFNKNLRDKYSNNPLVKIGIAPHSLRAVDLTQLKLLLQGVDTSLPIHIHIAEQIAEVEQSKQVKGQTPVNLLFNEVEVNRSWCLIHATHLVSEEVSKIAKSGAIVGLCPTTEANLGDGLFPLTEFQKQQGCWGIGSDSHICIDPKQELLLLEYGQRLKTFERVVYSCAERTSTATNLLIDSAVGGKRALQSEAGTIEEGSRADLLSLKVPAQYSHYNARELSSKWLYASRDNWISDVMVAGNWVVTDGHHKNQHQANRKLAEVLKRLSRA